LELTRLWRRSLAAPKQNLPASPTLRRFLGVQARRIDLARLAMDACFRPKTDEVALKILLDRHARFQILLRAIMD